VNRTTVSLLVAGVAGLMLATSAMATSAPPRSEVVRFGDLDLHTDAGINALYTRLRTASNEVCGAVGIRELTFYAAESACVERALSAAVANVHSPELSARHQRGASPARVARL
jgi:UrcA family protein